MATGTIILSIPPSAVDQTNPPGMRFEDHRWELLFDDATDEIVYWTFRLPQDYASAPAIKWQYKMTSATALEVIIRVAIMAVSDGDAADVDAPSFDTDNTSSATTVPGTAGHLDEISMALSNNDSMAAGDFVTIRGARDADNAGDDATGDMETVAVSLEYTTT